MLTAADAAMTALAAQRRFTPLIKRLRSGAAHGRSTAGEQRNEAAWCGCVLRHAAPLCQQPQPQQL